MADAKFISRWLRGLRLKAKRQDEPDYITADFVVGGARQSMVGRCAETKATAGFGSPFNKSRRSYAAARCANRPATVIPL